MTQSDQPNTPPKDNEAVQVTANKFISVVWIIPLIALITGGWLLMNHIKTIGPEVTLRMNSAEGIQVDQTVVKILSVEVGRVTSINLRPGNDGVEVKARLKAGMEEYMRTDTKFWVVKPRIGLEGITGLGTLVSGSYIEFAPGKDAAEQDTFVVSEDPPSMVSNKPGLSLKLSGQDSRMLPVGNPILYRDITVGRIERADFNPKDETINYEIFINKPYDEMIGKNTQFWVLNGFDIQATGAGIKIRSGPITSLINGAISFSSPKEIGKGSTVKNGQEFVLYSDVDKVLQQPSERALYYVAVFEQSIRGLEAGADIQFQGVNIGSVSQVPFFERNDSLNMFHSGKIPVLLRIEPGSMELNADEQSQQEWLKRFELAIEQGLTAKLESNSLITGSLFVELSQQPQNRANRTRQQYHGYTMIPTAASGLARLEDQIIALLDKLNNLPIEKSMTELNGTLNELKLTLNSVNKVIDSDETRNLPKQLNQTMRQVETLLKGVSPDAPIYQEAQETIKQINQTLQEVKPVIRTLNEKPNALIFNNKQVDPTPKGAK
ncbi:MAG: intermembrane transport protein PqiB [Neisseriaceae bacterium]|nr:intermembrane transport protein PqiB [Neisseriaceae bacterium]MBP6861083.1 intermembrane transport protein PqiB [Neisseriaceae bacterium]